MRHITPYLNFDGDCREAMTFYQRCLGGELELKAFGEGGGPPGAADRIMHARLTRGGLRLMASDTMPGSTVQRGTDCWLSIDCERDDEVDALFAALSADGGASRMAPQDTFWGARFAMLVDRFGVRWMLNHERALQRAG